VLSPGDSGYFTCIQNMKLFTNKFKSGGLHEKHVVATWMRISERKGVSPSEAQYAVFECFFIMNFLLKGKRRKCPEEIRCNRLWCHIEWRNG
jgi:hypothetical protein